MTVYIFAYFLPYNENMLKMIHMPVKLYYLLLFSYDYFFGVGELDGRVRVMADL